MSNHKSAEKKARQDEDRRSRNRSSRTRLRTQIKKFRAALGAGDVAAAKEMLPGTASLIDRSAKLGVIHTNTADRTKSRLTRALARAEEVGTTA
jgi:small subunit ribosomal protein S20